MSLDTLIGQRIDSDDLIRVRQANTTDQISYYNQLKKIPSLSSNVPEEVSTEGGDILIKVVPDKPQTLMSSITKIIALLNKFRAVPLKKLRGQRLPNSIALYEKAFDSIVKENENLDSALRRFKRNCAKAGIQQEIRKREHYEKPSVRRKKKSEAARKRKFK